MNAVFMAMLYSRLYRTTPRVDRNSRLPRPNQYIGLELLNSSQLSGISTLGPIINHAPIMTQVSTEAPKYVFPDDTHRLFTLFGTVSSEDRRFLVNDTASWMIFFF